ncbi:MAG TPA: tRNA (adenosine(37)-N6)-threonylcarbamoyltransferase complex ATPase subunit type 1 TsaE [Steroidobacteraceae bacterium]
MRESLIRLARSAEEMERFGAALGRALPPPPSGPAILYLEGELGAGKTTLARGLIAGRGFAGAARSPTFTLLERYALEGLTVIHIDLYRLSDPRELETLGLRDFALPWHLWLIEWPERGTNVLPAPDLRVALGVTPEGHPVEASAHSPLGHAWLAATTALTGVHDDDRRG